MNWTERILEYVILGGTRWDMGGISGWQKNRRETEKAFMLATLSSHRELFTFETERHKTEIIIPKT